MDWDTVTIVPAPIAVQHPLFISNIPGYLNRVPKDMDFAEDRAYLVEAMRKLSTDASNVADLLSSSFERQFFELSLRNRHVNNEYFELRLENVEFPKMLELISSIFSFPRIRRWSVILRFWNRRHNSRRRSEEVMSDLKCKCFSTRTMHRLMIFVATSK
jgi:hypothetical protein